MLVAVDAACTSISAVVAVVAAVAVVVADVVAAAVVPLRFVGTDCSYHHYFCRPS